MNTRQLKKWAIIALTLIIITALAYYFLKPTPQAPNHITAIAEIGDIEQTVIATGKVKAINTVNVGAQVSGEIQTLYVKVGDVVEKGDLIAQIDQVNQRTNLQNATSSLSQSRFEQSSALAELNSRHAALESAKADLQSQQALAKQARTNLQRLKPLIGIDAISQQEYDNAVAQADTADAAVAKAKANISQMQAAIAQAQANIANQKESVNKAHSNLSAHPSQARLCLWLPSKAVPSMPCNLPPPSLSWQIYHKYASMPKYLKQTWSMSLLACLCIST